MEGSLSYSQGRDDVRADAGRQGDYLLTISTLLVKRGRRSSREQAKDTG